MVVATPLPPLKPVNNGYVCPRTAPGNPHKPREISPEKEIQGNKNHVVAINPLRKSRKKTKYPAGFPMVLSTLVAPGLPLPTEKISTPFLFAMRTPKGMDPKI